LVICNKKNESEYIFNKLKDKNECYHISAAMCMAHRKEVMKKVRDRIKEKESGPVICVSTQVMEAGVDISFTKVVRLLAGMESVVQAAGRCNRNGECEKIEKVHIINCTDENLSKFTKNKKYFS
jgi:CRISPR-associated endonuclease/helicase Cas3